MTLSAEQIAGGGPDAAAGSREAAEPRYLFGPVIDFLCLGGLSLVVAPIMFVLPREDLTVTVAAFALGLAHFINHPHFAFSYQIFYAGFRRKAFGRDTDRVLRARYIFAGIVVPAALAVFFAYSLVFGDARLLGRGANVMAFLVGWHYVKQGYGMLMVDAALKRRFFNDGEKKILLANAYAVWALAWLVVNTVLAERAMWGIDYYMFEIPSLVLAAGTSVAVATTVMTVSTLVTAWQRRRTLPWNGVVAYGVSLYVWLLLMHWNVLWLLLVPAMHSLQYLVVVARYRLNRDRNRAEAQEAPRLRPLRFLRRRYLAHFAGFASLGLVLGYVGFWGAPQALQAIVPFDRGVFGATALLFVFWIFINVHHYFLDNVMWRRENPDVAKYLFA